MNKYVVQAAAFLASAQAGAAEMSEDFKQRARDKWELSKSLPRKAKKLMRKDALLDWSLGEWTEENSNRMFGL